MTLDDTSAMRADFYTKFLHSC